MTRRARINGRALGAAAVVGVAALAASGLVSQAAVASSGTLAAAGTAGATVGKSWYVSPTGSDSSAGTTAATPFATLQAALNRVRPGDTVHLGPGTYVGDVHTVTSGTSGAPISIEGGDDPESDAAGSPRTVVYGTGHVIDINNSWYRLGGFTLDGQQAVVQARSSTGASATGYPAAASLQAKPTLMTAFKTANQKLIHDGRLIYVGDSASRVTGTVVDHMLVQGGGGECIRLRNGATDSVISNSIIRYCGMFAKSDGSAEKDGYLFHNGEGVYLGTSPTTTNLSNYADDQTDDNLVTGNIITTYGSECVDVKENASGNVVQGNNCGDNLEPAIDDGSNLEVRGDHTTVTGNTVHDSPGWNIKLQTDSPKYDLGGNVIAHNALTNAGNGVNLQIDGETDVTVCGNTLDAGSNSPTPPTAPCPPGVPIGSPTSSPSSSASPISSPSKSVPMSSPATVSPTASPKPSTSHSSSPSTSATTTGRPTSPPPLVAPVTVEAESGVLTAGFLNEAVTGASGGHAVVANGTGTDTFSVTTSAGKLLITGRVLAANKSSDSFRISVDGGSAETWVLPADGMWMFSTAPAFEVDAGTHSIVISYREQGATVDTLTLALS